jgi:hypothetical protein
VCERWVTGPENHTAAKVDVELLLQRLLDVDLREDTEALVLESAGHLLDRLREGSFDATAESVRTHDIVVSRNVLSHDSLRGEACARAAPLLRR